MNCRLIAKEYVELYDIFQNSMEVHKGQVIKGTKHKISDKFYTITIEVNGSPTPYYKEVVEEFFEIHDVNPLEIN